MKRVILITILLITVFFLLAEGHDYTKKQLSARTYEVIPDEAIRLRILANSDEEIDQNLKHFVRDQVSEQINEWVGHMTDINEARNYIRRNIPKLQKMVEENFEERNIPQQIEVEYDSNVPFPMKLYDSVLYPAGDYEAVLITLGEGKGANWWCVLFPPLCVLDFDNGSTIAEQADQTEEARAQKRKAKFFLLEWLGLS